MLQDLEQQSFSYIILISSFQSCCHQSDALITLFTHLFLTLLGTPATLRQLSLQNVLPPLFFANHMNEPGYKGIYGSYMALPLRIAFTYLPLFVPSCIYYRYVFIVLRLSPLLAFSHTSPFFCLIAKPVSYFPSFHSSSPYLSASSLIAVASPSFFHNFFIHSSPLLRPFLLSLHRN